MISVAFPLIGRGSWTGGYVYLKNTLRVIGSRLNDKIAPTVFLSPQDIEKYGAELAELTNGKLIVDEDFSDAQRSTSLARSLTHGRDFRLERHLKKAGVDAVFEVASFYGLRFGLPVISWIPDFQHRHMPGMFSQLSRWRREIGFRAQIYSNRTLMVSSHTARDDMENFYPGSRGRGHVVRFAIDLNIPAQIGRAAQLRQKYELPERFFYLPNQFWRHKNHSCIVAALAELRAANSLAELPPVILTGLDKDPRNPEHLDRLMRDVHAAGVESNFRYLGLIPYEDVLGLAATCRALINPSLFEGWSTPIEEAKALGAPLLLSDILIHREQAPHAHFFDPNSPSTLAKALIDSARPQHVARKPVAELLADQNARLVEHAESLMQTVNSAISVPKSSGRAFTAITAVSKCQCAIRFVGKLQAGGFAEPGQSSSSAVELKYEASNYFRFQMGIFYSAKARYSVAI